MPGLATRFQEALASLGPVAYLVMGLLLAAIMIEALTGVVRRAFGWDDE